jgi:hypothetical protein
VTIAERPKLLRKVPSRFIQAGFAMPQKKQNTLGICYLIVSEVAVAVFKARRSGLLAGEPQFASVASLVLIWFFDCPNFALKWPYRLRTGASMSALPEILWLRSRVIRMRALLRFAKDIRVETGLRELISDAETRLEWQEEQARAQRSTTQVDARLTPNA